MADDDQSPFPSQIYFMFIAVASAAVVLLLYHWIEASCLRRPPPRQEGGGAASGVESSTAELIIPAHKYRKGMEVDGDGDGDGTCAVCLCEFEEGEELRTLPECMHSFHVACIDMWLYSHSNCPMCRTQATPSPHIFPPQSLPTPLIP